MDADSIHWREVLPFKDEELPGVFLAEALKIDPRRLLAV